VDGDQLTMYYGAADEFVSAGGFGQSDFDFAFP
jgi:hypothetical protein